MLTSRKFIEITDFGAGSAVTTKKHRTVKSIAKHSSRKKVNKLLYRSVAYIQPDYIVELGTSFGFSTMYMSKASDNQIYTVEGDKAIADLAQKNFEKLELKNVNLLNMSFDAALHHLSKKFTGRGLLFIDGNHTYTATLEYFYFLCKHLRDDSVLIFDDINWSKGMQHAWKVIVKSSKVPLTIELFDVGIVFLKKKLYKQHYIMKY
jgi:predicted O-methyltransferase YrrM